MRLTEAPVGIRRESRGQGEVSVSEDQCRVEKRVQACPAFSITLLAMITVIIHRQF